jgi:hypothetical protein
MLAILDIMILRCAGIALLVACGQNPPPPVAPPQQPALSTEVAVKTVEGMAELGKHGPYIGGYFVDASAILQHLKLGSDWANYAKLYPLRIRGEPFDYKCAPNEQCLLGGKIPTLRNITTVELICPTGTKLIGPAPCPGNDLSEALHCKGRECPRDGKIWNGTACVAACQ